MEHLETWRPVTVPTPGRYYRSYEVSDKGRVRSIGNTKGDVCYLKPDVRSGYFSINIGYRHHRIHSLVMLAFIGPRPPGMQVRHLNGHHLDNRLGNLCYGTPKENADDTELHGKNPKGEQRCNHKMSSVQVLHIRARRDVPARVFAQFYKVSPTAITDARNGRTWRHVS